VNPTHPLPPIDRRALYAFAALPGPGVWAARIADIARQAAAGPRAGQALRQRQSIQLAIEQLRRSSGRAIPAIGHHVADLAAQAVALARRLTPAGRVRFDAMIHAAMHGDGNLVPLFHLLRTAALHRARGFGVHFAGLEDGAPFDLLLSRDHAEAEVACHVVSAEEGRHLHRGAWFRLADRIDPDLQTWLAAHPGRYLLKVTLPDGLRIGPQHGAEDGDLAALHQRIRDMLERQRRQDYSESVMLRLDPLLLAGAQADELGLVSRLRHEFGPEAHLSVTAAGDGVFVMAARTGRENEIAAAVRRRMAAITPTRLTGTRPGILAMFVDEIDRTEWRALREHLELEGEARQFLLHPAAQHVVAVTCASRLELFGMAEPDAAPDGELRFRNPAHPAARIPALAPAVLSLV
jgi:hypothetical protein